MSFGFVQKNATFPAVSTATVAVTLNGVTAGNLICVAIWDLHDDTLLSVLDQNNVVYTVTPNSPSPFDPGSAGIGKLYLAYKINAPGGNTTITATFNVSGSSLEIWAIEFSVLGGSAVFDVDGEGSDPVGSNTINLPSLALKRSSGELLYGIGAPFTGVTSVNSPWTGGTKATDTGIEDGYITSSSGSPVAMNETLGGTNPQWTSISMAVQFISTPVITNFGDEYVWLGGDEY